ncbi:MAG: polysaccharide biosynthesis protein [Bacilli bacterium]|nr:polysaccharide biosynthesis protein [Bacilli bacterium]
MRKEKFITSTIILIIGGFITKVLGMFIKIVITRLIGLEGIGLYMLILPTFSLFMTLAQLGLPVAISKLVAEETKNNKRLFLSTIPLVIIINIILMIVIIGIAPLLANHLLNETRILYPLLSISIVLPFISISCIVRGYFFGKQKMLPHVISHIVEQIVRVSSIALFVPILLKSGLEYAVSGVVLVNVISELVSIIILVGYLPKNLKLKLDDFKPNMSDIKDVLNIGLPTTGNRVIGSISYFLEPIILTQVLLLIGYSRGFILTEYGALSGYVFPLLLIPSFFSQAISSALIPVVSKSYANNNIKYIKLKLKQAILISFTIGILVSISFIIMPSFLLQLVYKTNKGIEYLRFLAPIYLLHYIEIPLAGTLQAMNKAKDSMFNTLKGTVLKNILLLSLSFLKIGIYGLLIAVSSGIIVITILDYIKVKKYLS